MVEIDEGFVSIQKADGSTYRLEFSGNISHGRYNSYRGFQYLEVWFDTIAEEIKTPAHLKWEDVPDNSWVLCDCGRAGNETVFYTQKQLFYREMADARPIDTADSYTPIEVLKTND